MEESIIWLNPVVKEGTATLSAKGIILNTVAATKFQNAYRVKIGVNKAARQLIIVPLTRDQIEKGVYDESSLLKPQIEKSFTKISSVELMRSIASIMELELGKAGEKYPAKWNEDSASLYINIERRTSND